MPKKSHNYKETFIAEKDSQIKLLQNKIIEITSQNESNANVYLK